MAIKRQIDIKGWIQLTPYDQWTFSTSEDMTDYGYVNLMPYTINAAVPPTFDPTSQRIAVLEKKREALRRKFQEEVMKVNEEISKLQAIGYNPNGQVIDDIPF